MIVLSPIWRQRRLTLASVVALSAILAGCGSSVQVRHQDASEVHERHYRSYEVLQHPVGREESVDQIIETAIHDRMRSKGYERKAASDADLLVSYKVLLSGESAPVAPLEEASPRPASASEPDALWDAVWVSVPSVSVANAREPSREKTLLVMLQEADTYKIVWLGWSRTEVDSEDLATVTKQAIDEIMARVPEVK